MMKFFVSRTSMFDEQPCEEARAEGTRWVLRLGSLKQLLAFQEKYGELVLKSDAATGEPAIEIYDDYRE